MLDIGGFLTSTDFLSQLASIIATIISTVLSSVIAGLLGTAA